MASILGIIAVLGFIGALGAVRDRLRKHRRRTVVPSAAARTKAQETLDYYAKVWDSTEQ